MSSQLSRTLRRLSIQSLITYTKHINRPFGDEEHILWIETAATAAFIYLLDPPIHGGASLEQHGKRYHRIGRGLEDTRGFYASIYLSVISRHADFIASYSGTTEVDIHNQRLAQMNQFNIDYMVLSCATPCIQGISDPAAASVLATQINDELARLISNNTLRFGAFASLSMHNASEAAAELKRAVEELGFLGALVNDYQQSGENNETLIYYDQPEFDVFWQMVVDLDVPVYFHPRQKTNVAPISALSYDHAPWIRGPGNEFSVILSNHILGLCTNGVFARFPTLKIIVGHFLSDITSQYYIRRYHPRWFQSTTFIAADVGLSSSVSAALDGGSSSVVANWNLSDAHPTFPVK
ncbi:hypothetical protein D9757_007390 [Collybiopsis confluens]|uniref:Amidohydrolase-related domain-containing protein n=1 Tax=Collybiopsis confluens TaxID=2823264 RepID=A0A8H5HIN7_9AGAR|nr:hypothetical protein D9757_007390 [Collybiopsis confluens]